MKTKARCSAATMLLTVLLVSSARPQAAASASAPREGQAGRDTLSRTLYFGADYYFEDHSPEQVESDAAAMQRAGLNVVRMLDTNWAEVEPRDGQFDFARLDHALDALDRHGIETILGVPSYVPPMWLLHAHPEWMLIDEHSVRYQPGGMGFINILDPQYRVYVQRLDEALARHYGNDRRVIGWQIDNELGIWGAACYNASCRHAFDRYLQGRFRTINQLNDRWGTVSYGHQYSSFDEVPLDALPTGEGHQSSLQFEVRRFFSTALTEFVAQQTHVFHHLAPNQFITHNTVGPNLHLNYFQLAKVLDFTSYDNYPRTWPHDDSAFTLDLARAYNGGGPYLILEELSGAPGPYTLTGAQAPPGQLRLWAYQTLAHGGNGVLFFRWRTARSGSEEFWQGLLDPAGQSTRRLQEIAAMGSEVRKLAPMLLSTRVHAQIALLFSWDSWSAMDVGDAQTTYVRQLGDWHANLAQEGVNVDVIPPDADLRGYRIVIAPELYVVDEPLAQKLSDFVRNGGALVTGPRSGTKDEDNRFSSDLPFPSRLADLAGVRVAEITLLPGGQPAASADYQPATTNAVRSTDPALPGTFQATEWADILEPTTARTLLTYTRDYYAGRPAVTRNRLGRGSVIYLGSVFDSRFRTLLVRSLMRETGIRTLAAAPLGVEVTRRDGDNQSLIFLMNFTPQTKVVAMSGAWQDAISGLPAGSNIAVPAIGVRILRETSQRAVARRTGGVRSVRTPR